MNMCAREKELGPTAGLRVSVGIADEAGDAALWGREDGFPGNGARVAQIRVTADQHQSAADALQRAQPQRLDVERLYPQRQHTPADRNQIKQENTHRVRHLVITTQMETTVPLLQYNKQSCVYFVHDGI